MSGPKEGLCKVPDPASFLGDKVMQSQMMIPAETENGFALLLRLNWDRALSATFIVLSLCLGSWLASM
ncbi:hypothetical protein NBRC116598_25980 [Pseudophaeobacter arcticus]|jgi:hypothetical protein|uniref:Uncharacterized protein n=1 Tax=Pseudophaeobacter arcticus TaxID=385492 RepID=A0ABQ0AMU1_9RHOB